MVNKEDEIIRMAREAGFDIEELDSFNYKPQLSFICTDSELVRFYDAAYDKGLSAWTQIAFARLGVVRDSMSPEDVLVIQNFLNYAFAESFAKSSALEEK